MANGGDESTRLLSSEMKTYTGDSHGHHDEHWCEEHGHAHGGPNDAHAGHDAHHEEKSDEEVSKLTQAVTLCFIFMIVEIVGGAPPRC
jgi:hypothetical protein